MERKTLDISAIIKDQRTQPRAVIDSVIVDEYRADMLAGDTFPPVIVFQEDSKYYLADGWHRLTAAEQIGNSTIEAKVKPGTLRDAILYSCGVNYDHGKRRTRGDKERAIKKMLYDPEWRYWADRDIARQCRVSHHTVAKLRSVIHTGQMPSMNRKFIHPKTGTVSIMDTSKIGKSTETEKLPQQPIFELPTLEHKQKYDPHNYELIVSPINKLSEHIETNSIDAIITDPPYGKKFINLFEDLAITAKQLLKDGGVLVVLCGNYYLPEYLNLINKHLTYHWLGSYYMPNPPYYFDKRKLVSNRSKPIIIATKGKWIKKHFTDTVINVAPDKEFHEWGQGITGFTALVEQFTNPNEMILDPFVGGGTTALAALNSGRYFKGSDIDKKQIEITRGRLNNG